MLDPRNKNKNNTAHYTAHALPLTNHSAAGSAAPDPDLHPVIGDILGS